MEGSEWKWTLTQHTDLSHLDCPVLLHHLCLCVFSFTFFVLVQTHMSTTSQDTQQPHLTELMGHLPTATATSPPILL